MAAVDDSSPPIRVIANGWKMREPTAGFTATEIRAKIVVTDDVGLIVEFSDLRSRRQKAFDPCQFPVDAAYHIDGAGCGLFAHHKRHGIPAVAVHLVVPRRPADAHRGDILEQ